MDRGQAVVAGGLDDLRDQYRRVQMVFDADAPERRFAPPASSASFEKDGR